MLLVLHVVARPLLRIAQDAIRLADLTESRRVPGLLVVGMVALRQQAIHAVDGFQLRVRADLEDFVMINDLVSHTFSQAGSRAGAPETYFAPMRFFHSS
jgi:hypothetical protein